MSVTQISGRIKTILRPPTNPKPGYRFRIKTRLYSAHDYLISVKESHRPEFKVVKVKLSSKQEQSIPKWFDSLLAVLQLYLDVIILRDKALVGIEPIDTLTIIGDEPDVILAQHYIDYLFTAVSRITNLKREEVSNKNRRIRRKKNRRGVGYHTEDARVIASGIRDTMLKDILSILNSLLDSLEKDNPLTREKGLARQTKVQSYLQKKYSKKWKTVVLTN